MWHKLPLLGLAIAGLALAQDPPARVGRLAYVSGPVSFDPAGVNDWVPGAVNRPLTIGDQVFCDDGARAVVEAPGSAIRLGSRTAFEFLNLDDSNFQVRLSEGTMDVRVRRLDTNLEVDTPNLAFTITGPGEYRLDANADNPQTSVTVRDGQGQITGPGGTFVVHAGQQAVVTGQDQATQFQVYAAPGYDDFDNWVISRNRLEDRYAYSRYVSPEVVGYEDLGAYGTWRSVPEYGEVWVPRVAAGWAPYQDGHWAWVDPWGWTWVDSESWGFAPFHYGRWAFIDGSWGWCPGALNAAPVYAPALVAWVGLGGGAGVSVGIGGGAAVGWFPLGPRDVYVPAYKASQAYVTRINTTNTTIINNTTITNVYTNYVRTGSVPVTGYMNHAVPGAVVAVPQTALTSARPVKQVAVRLRPNQIVAVKAVVAAPRVTPQVASVLGHPVSAEARVPRPPAAVISRPIVARSAPPPAPPSFQQRQTILAHNPGKPVPIPQLHEMARTAPGSVARPAVKVVAQAPRIQPSVAKVTAPRNVRAPQNTVRPGQPPARSSQPGAPAANARTVPPPAQPSQARQRNGQAARAQAPQPPARPNRPYEPPAVEGRRTSQPPPVQAKRRPETAPPVQQQSRTQPRPNEPPAARGRPAAQPPKAQARQARRVTPPAQQQSRGSADRRATPPEHKAAPNQHKTAPPAKKTDKQQ